MTQAYHYSTDKLRASGKMKLERLRTFLTGKPRSQDEIRAFLCMSKSAVYRYIRILHRGQVKQIYIKKWERNVAAPPTPFYAWGDKKDAPKPAPYTEQQQGQRFYAKMKREEPERYVSYLERARHSAKIRHRRAKGLPEVPPDPMLAWIPRKDLKEAA